MGLFGTKAGSAGTGPEAGRSSRHSSGWLQMSKHLHEQESLRLLDIGPTSAGNINFVTSLGHSIYMANLVEDAARKEYLLAHIEGDALNTVDYDVTRFLELNLDFSGRTFNVVTLWDTIDYLPQPFVQPVLDRIYEVMEPGGQLLAFFHSKVVGDDTVFSRYHLTGTDRIELQRVAGYPILHTYTNRQVEGLFNRYASYKFFLAKDTLREVIVTR